MRPKFGGRSPGHRCAIIYGTGNISADNAASAVTSLRATHICLWLLSPNGAALATKLALKGGRNVPSCQLRAAKRLRLRVLERQLHTEFNSSSARGQVWRAVAYKSQRIVVGGRDIGKISWLPRTANDARYSPVRMVKGIHEFGAYIQMELLVNRDFLTQLVEFEFYRKFLTSMRFDSAN
jgi:hypothetical protein